MILAGIDEAGLGPTLGPLITSCCVFQVPNDYLPFSLWYELQDVVSKEVNCHCSHILVTDSKLIYRRFSKNGLAIPLLCMCQSRGFSKTNLLSYLLDEYSFSESSKFVWYNDISNTESISLSEFYSEKAELLSIIMQDKCIFLKDLSARFCSSLKMNRLYSSGLNKNEVLFFEVGFHLQQLFQRYQEENVLIVVDKLGGRNDYLSLLYKLFPGYWIYNSIMSKDLSEYVIKREGRNFIIRFVVKGDKDSFPTSLASMSAKYVRECFMTSFNQWFCSKKPDLVVTAGYPLDARRWLESVKDIIDRENICLNSLVRER